LALRKRWHNFSPFYYVTLFLTWQKKTSSAELVFRYTA